MNIVFTSIFPPGKSVEVAGASIKARETPLPPYIKEVIVLAKAGGEQGIVVLTIYEADDDKVPEAVKELAKRIADNYYAIEGYRYQMDLMLTREETLPLLGL